ncbi:MAG: F0F1 ATP synthase subunit B [Halanaerobiales bacterium]
MVNINTTMLWHVINFFVLLWLLKRYLYGPIKEILDKRAEKVKNEINEAEHKREEAGKLKEKYESELKKARREAQDIIEKAENRARIKAKQIINEAQERADKIKEDRLEEVARARQQAFTELRDEVSSMSLMVASRFIEENIDENGHQQLIEEYRNNLDQVKLGEV